MGFSRQESWGGLQFPSPEDLPHPRTEPWSPSLQAKSLPFEQQGSPLPFNSYQNTVVRNTIHQRLPWGPESRSLFLGMLCLLRLRLPTPAPHHLLGSNQPFKVFILETRRDPLLSRIFVRGTCHLLVENGIPFMRTLERNFCWASTVLLLLQILKRLLLTRFLFRYFDAQKQICRLHPDTIVCSLYTWFDFISHLISHCSHFICETRNKGGWERSWR